MGKKATSSKSSGSTKTKTAKKAAGKTVAGRPSAKAAKKVAKKPVKKVAKKIANKAAKKIANKAAKKGVKKVVGKAVSKTISKAGKVAKKIANKAAKKSVKKVVGKAVSKTISKAGKAAKKIANKTAKKSVKKVVGKAVSKTISKAGKAAAKGRNRTKKATAARKPVKSQLTKAEINRYRQMLLAKRHDLLGDLTGIEAEALKKGSQDVSSDLSTLPTHPADIGTDNYEQEFTLGLLESERTLLREIDDALVRIQEGKYGTCQGTGKPISKARLLARPWSRYCIEYARLIEKGLIQPDQETDYSARQEGSDDDPAAKGDQYEDEQ